MRAAGASDHPSQAFLDKVGHQNLRSLLILHQDIMRGGDLVSLKAIQQCNTNHSRWREKIVRHVVCAKISFVIMLAVIGSSHKYLSIYSLSHTTYAFIDLYLI